MLATPQGAGSGPVLGVAPNTYLLVDAQPSEQRGARIAPFVPAGRPHLFAGDPVACPADELPDLPVVLTMVGGRVVHHADT